MGCVIRLLARWALCNVEMMFFSHACYVVWLAGYVYCLRFSLLRRWDTVLVYYLLYVVPLVVGVVNMLVE